jgi:formaldehyde-activating enzyme involved in methanogenesis
MNVEDVDGRFGDAAAGTRPNGSHINLVIGRRGSPTAAAAATADVRPGHAPLLLCLGAGNLERTLDLLASRESASNRFYRGE